MITARIDRLSKVIVLTLTALLLTTPPISRADDDICPEVYPCDEYGELLPIFEDIGGTCGKRFYLLCKDVRISAKKECSNLSEEYNRLQERQQRTLKSIKKLKSALKAKTR
jgi:hypothetical protein